MALDTRFPASMTGFLKCVYNDESSSLGTSALQLITPVQLLPCPAVQP